MSDSLIAKWTPYVKALAHRLKGAEFDDLCQSGFLGVIKAANGGTDTKTRIRAEMIDEIRRSSIKRRDYARGMRTSMFEGASDTSGTYDNVETHVDIIRALERMPKESANLLWQINYEGRSQREVAKELGITESAVSHRLTRSDSCV